MDQRQIHKGRCNLITEDIAGKIDIHIISGKITNYFTALLINNIIIDGVKALISVIAAILFIRLPFLWPVTTSTYFFFNYRLACAEGINRF